MTCAESEILLHALLDGELDAGHAREMETHLESCPRCAVQLRGYRELQQAMPAAQLRFAAPISLRRRIETAIPSAPAALASEASGQRGKSTVRAPDTCPEPGSSARAAHSASEEHQGVYARLSGLCRERAFPSEASGQRGNSEACTSSRRSVFKGFAMGSAFSAAVAATLFIAIIRTDHDQSVLGDVLSAHLRSLQGEHLTDVQTSDQHTVKPWFNGKLDVAPPVVDLTAQGFTLVGGRLDYVDGKPVASIVYRRRAHVINLFVAQGAVSNHHGAKLEKVQGFNIRRWSTKGLEFWAISDLGTDELQEFGAKFEAALHSVGGT
jgi:anti-sigma factor RsiW